MSTSVKVSVSKNNKKTSSKTAKNTENKEEYEFTPEKLIERANRESIFFQMPGHPLDINITGYRLRYRIIQGEEKLSMDIRIITEDDQERSQIANIPDIAAFTWRDIMSIFAEHKLRFKEPLGADIYPNLRAPENGGFDWQHANLMVNVTARNGKNGQYWMNRITELKIAKIEIESTESKTVDLAKEIDN